MKKFIQAMAIVGVIFLGACMHSGKTKNATDTTTLNRNMDTARSQPDTTSTPRPSPKS